MNYNEHLTAGRAMKPAEVDATIRELAKDPRFAAVVVWIDRNKESFNNAVVNQSIAAHHGSLAHAAGSGHALRTLEGQLRNLIDPQPPKPSRRPAED